MGNLSPSQAARATPVTRSVGIVSGRFRMLHAGGGDVKGEIYSAGDPKLRSTRVGAFSVNFQAVAQPSESSRPCHANLFQRMDVIYP